MQNSLKKLTKVELIGTHIKIIEKGIQGIIIDETKNLFVIKTKENIKKIVKKNNKMQFQINNKKIVIDGEKLIMRPEERIKIKVKP